MKKTRIAVLMGGQTPEHEISLISGKEVISQLNKKKYTVLPVLISRDGKKWKYISTTDLLKTSNDTLLSGDTKAMVKKSKKEISGARQIAGNVDVVFIAMHGPFGEDGTVQGMLELAGVKYTGPGVLASALGMDKLIFRKMLSSMGVPFPKYVPLKKSDKKVDLKKHLGPPPYFIKPHNQGSSVGCYLAKKEEEVTKAVRKAWKYSEIALVDEYIEGIEVTCGVIGNEKPIALPLVEIVPLKGEYFDYESKYTESGADEIVPARLPKTVTKNIQDMAVKVYEELGCKGFSRVDFILKNRKDPYVLEINTIPGLTPMSLLPKAALAAGFSYPNFLDKIVKYAVK